MKNFITLLFSYCYRALFISGCDVQEIIRSCRISVQKSGKSLFWKIKPEMGDNITLSFKEIDLIDVDWVVCT